MAVIKNRDLYLSSSGVHWPLITEASEDTVLLPVAGGTAPGSTRMGMVPLRDLDMDGKGVLWLTSGDEPYEVFERRNLSKEVKGGAGRRNWAVYRLIDFNGKDCVALVTWISCLSPASSSAGDRGGDGGDSEL